MAIRLSICIATLNRGKFISETLDSILKQCSSEVEVVVVDGASSDNTPEIMASYVSKYPQVKYFRELENSGVDADFDKAVGYARGEFCWLMTDDDLLMLKAVDTVIDSITGEDDLIIVNSELRNLDLTEVYEHQRLKLSADKEYRNTDGEAFFIDTASYLSFIGCVVIRRSFWLSRDRESYFGTLFVHVGVIFQSPAIQNVKVIAKPLITIRYGNAMWTPRSFEIWMFKWPKLIWSFMEFSDDAKRIVNQHEPWRDAFRLFYYRALGAYGFAQFQKLLPSSIGKRERLVAFMISCFPTSLANFILLSYFSVRAKQPKMIMHDFLYAPSAGFLSNLLAKTLGLK